MEGFYSPQTYNRNVTSALNNEIETFNRFANDALERFIKSENPWGHCFADPSTGNYTEAREYDKEDAEASILSKSVFYSLMRVVQALVFEEGQKPIPMMDLNWCGCGSLSMPKMFMFKNSDFHFDVMNNPNAISAAGKISNKLSIGGMSILKSTPLSFSSMRYTIGNFAPLPWWIARTGAGRSEYNLQALHRDLAEWWDMLLLYLHWRMDEFANDSIPPKDRTMSFVDYIISTCQFFYIENLSRAGKDRDLFKKLYAGNITAEKFCNEIDNDKAADEDGDTGWTKHVKLWAQVLRKKGSGLRILSLMNAGAKTKRYLEMPECLRDEKTTPLANRSGAKFKENYWANYWQTIRDYDACTSEKIRQTDKLICRLIEVRGRCIMGLLRENKEMLGF